MDDTLHVLSKACNCSLTDLVSQHSAALLDLLQPVPESMHAASDLLAYSHLLLPWTTLLHVTRAAGTAVVAAQPQLPQTTPFCAEVPERQSQCLHPLPVVQSCFCEAEGPSMLMLYSLAEYNFNLAQGGRRYNIIQSREWHQARVKTHVSAAWSVAE